MNKDFNSRNFAKPFVVDEQERLRIEQILSLIGKGKSVLDVGCRDGTISQIIRDTGNEVECVEVSDYSIQKAREKGFKVYDADLNTKWPTSINRKYEVVFAGEVIEHLFETDNFLEGVREVLSLGGDLVLTTANLASLGRRILLFVGLNPVTEVTARPHEAGHLRYFVYGSLKKLLEEHGFIIEVFTSDVVNFNNSGSLRSAWLAKIFPTFGRSLIVKARKVS